ncbi:MAG: glycoside hydrolase family 35 protein [Tepidisphaeraceae bacterium]
MSPVIRQTLNLVDNGFTLGGKPFRLMGGALHYARVPKPYWRDRLNKLIDLGCNTVETYGFWNAHEPYPGQYDFSGMLDVVGFMELAGSMGLKVIYRPGPYCCAEWDMGGLPWWLLNEPGMALRCSQPAYMKHVERWWNELIPRVVPLQSTHGGPLIAMQFENEYGYFGNDKKYLAALRDLLRKLGIDVLLFTSDGTFQKLTIENGGLDGTLRTANFGSRAAERFAALREAQPTGPLVCMEYWVGWFDEWRTGKHATRPADECAQELDALLAHGGQAVIYMFQGGTNWGFTAGGNLSDDFKPFVTSYDYDALLTEAGDTTPKYDACRQVIHQRLGIPGSGERFAPSPKTAYGKVRLTEAAPLDRALPAVSSPVESATPLSMEALGHGRGFVVYRTQLQAIVKGQPLVIRGMHDWCHIRLNGKTLATWYRNDPQPSLTLDFDGDTATLEILVHNLARSNFGHRMDERKGITEGVFVGAARHDERALFGWTCHPLPLNDTANVPFARSGAVDGPAFYRGTMEIADEPTDTFLALPAFELGCVFVNGFNIGRYWKVGPQGTLYVPAPMLRRGTNEIVVFEAVACGEPLLEFVDQPELDRPAP